MFVELIMKVIILIVLIVMAGCGGGPLDRSADKKAFIEQVGQSGALKRTKEIEPSSINSDPDILQVITEKAIAEISRRSHNQ